MDALSVDIGSTLPFSFLPTPQYHPFTEKNSLCQPRSKCTFLESETFVEDGLNLSYAVPKLQ